MRSSFFLFFNVYGMDLSDNLINQFYDALSKEHTTLLKDLKESKGESENEKKEKAQHIQVSQINKLLNDLVRLRTLRKKISCL
jgi:hypothetical protein